MEMEKLRLKGEKEKEKGKRVKDKETKRPRETEIENEKKRDKVLLIIRTGWIKESAFYVNSAFAFFIKRSLFSHACSFSIETID